MFGFGYKQIKEYYLLEANKTGCNYCFWPNCKRRVEGFNFANEKSLRAHLNCHIRELKDESKDNIKK